MKIKNNLIIIGLIVFCTLASFSGGQCPQNCDGSLANTALGVDALGSTGDAGSFNTAIGAAALFNNTGTQNTAVGNAALINNTNGGANTVVGSNAGNGITTGSYNTAVGFYAALNSGDGSYNTTIGANAGGSGGYNTAVGCSTLLWNTTGANNTAIGYQALLNDSSGGSNVATGYDALYFNNGSFNTATGRGALYHNTTASDNVATGYQALNSVKTFGGNTATGTQALQSDTGGGNTADGYQALNKNTVGVQNVATGSQALFANTSGISNTAVGGFALGNSQTGSGNIALGYTAGSAMTSGSNNVDIANTGANESGTIRIGGSNQTNTYIAGINGVTVAGGLGVIVDSSGHLGTSTSSARYKENIQPMDKASEAILSLQPVTFRYKKELDPKAIPQFGLVAEQVEKVDPELVARDSDGKPYSVRYEAVNAMLLNEFLKAHRELEAQKAIIANQQKAIAALTQAFEEQAAQMQKVNARLAKVESAPRLVANTQ